VQISPRVENRRKKSNVSHYGDIVRKEIKKGKHVFGYHFVLEIIEAYESELEERGRLEDLLDDYMNYYCEQTGDYIIGFND